MKRSQPYSAWIAPSPYQRFNDLPLHNNDLSVTSSGVLYAGQNKNAPAAAAPEGLPSPSTVPPASTGPTPSPACDAAKQSGKTSACVEVVRIADDSGKNPTSAPSFTAAQNIWNKCCTSLSIGAGKIVNKSSYQTLDESPTDTPTQEEASLFKDAGASGCIQVFVPALLAMGGATGKDINGGGATYDAGSANPKIVLVESAAGEVLAHEIGHAIGAAHDTNPTVMKPTGHYNVANTSDVSPHVCMESKTGSVVKSTGTNQDCCMKF